MGEVRSVLATQRDLIHFRNNVGMLRDERGVPVRYGLCEGSADIIACVPTSLSCTSCGAPLPPIGRFVGIEVKGPNTRTTPEQFAWSSLVERSHGTAGIAHSAEDAGAIVQRARCKW
jgi:hypothetical protein